MQATAPARAVAVDFHGFRCRIEGVADACEAAAADFGAFPPSSADGPADFALRVHDSDPPPDAPGAGVPFRYRDARVRLRGERRRVRYAAGGAVLAASEREADLWCPDAALRHELLYLTVLSRVGAELDARGIHRVHAMGFERGGRGVLVLAPSGGGKTTLALEILRGSDARLLSDDVVLVGRDGALLPFPLRIGVVPPGPAWAAGLPRREFRRRRHGVKHLLDLPAGRVAVPTAPFALVLLERRAGKGVRTEPRVAPLSRVGAMRALVRDLVVGAGTPQVLEQWFDPRPHGLARHAAVAFSRWRAARALLARCRTFRLDPGSDPEGAARALLGLAEGQPAAAAGVQ